MLIDFKIKNYKSFYHLTDISLVADNTKQDDKQRLILLNKKGKNKKYVLPAMVIYGGNASGKTSMISAMGTLKEIIMNGTIKKNINNSAINKLEIDSFIHDAQKIKEPIEFSITFQSSLHIYEYIIGLKVDSPLIGNERKIIREELNIVQYQDIGTSLKEKKINLFQRDERQISLNKNEEILAIYDKGNEFLKDIINIEKNFNDNLDFETLFLTNSYKGSVSIKIANDILDWFENKLVVIVDFTKKGTIINFEGESEVAYFSTILDRLNNLADFGPQKIGYLKDSESGKYVLSSFYHVNGIDEGMVINSSVIESRGTIKLIDFWTRFIAYFSQGGVFFLDEFDCSIHPELIAGIISLFHDPQINTAHAQLIFNTHNPLFLQKQFFRRDQVMFIEKNDKNYISQAYKLSEFDIRKGTNYMKQYFEGKYGALPFIDFASAIQSQEEDRHE